MSRYQVLRRLCSCGPLTAGFIAFFNWLFGVRPGLIVCMTVEIEYDA